MSWANPHFFNPTHPFRPVSKWELKAINTNKKPIPLQIEVVSKNSAPKVQSQKVQSDDVQQKEEENTEEEKIQKKSDLDVQKENGDDESPKNDDNEQTETTVDPEWEEYNIIEVTYDEEGRAIIKASKYTSAFRYARMKAKKGELGIDGRWYWMRPSGTIYTTRDNPTGIMGTKLADNVIIIKLYKDDRLYYDNTVPRGEGLSDYTVGKKLTHGIYTLKVKSAHRLHTYRIRSNKSNYLTIEFVKDDQTELITNYHLTKIAEEGKKVVAENVLTPDTGRYKRLLEINEDKNDPIDIYGKQSLSIDKGRRVAFLMREFTKDEQKKMVANTTFFHALIEKMNVESFMYAVAKWDYTLQQKLMWDKTYNKSRGSDRAWNYQWFRETVILSSKEGFTPSKWKDFFVSICTNETMKMAVKDLELDADTRKKWLEAEGSSGSAKWLKFDDLTENENYNFLTEGFIKEVEKFDIPKITETYFAYANIQLVNSQNPDKSVGGYDVMFGPMPTDEENKAAAEHSIKRTKAWNEFNAIVLDFKAEVKKKKKEGAPIPKWNNEKNDYQAFEEFMVELSSGILWRFEKKAMANAHLILNKSEEAIYHHDVYTDTELDEIGAIVKKHKKYSEKERLEKFADNPTVAKKYPILLYQELDYDNLESYINAGKYSKAKMELETAATEVHFNIAKVRNRLRDPSDNVIWELNDVLEATKTQMGLAGTPVELAINKKQQEETALTWGETFVMIAGIALGVASIFVSGPAGVALLVASVGVGLYDVYITIDKYNKDKALANTHFIKAESLVKDDPSWIWVAVAFVGLGLDMVSAIKALKALKSLKGSGAITSIDDVAEVTDIVKRALPEDVAKTKQIVDELQDAGKRELDRLATESVERASKINAEIKASFKKLWNSGGKYAASNGFNPEMLEAIGELAVNFVKKGITSFDDFLKRLKLEAKIKGYEKIDWDNLSEVELKKLKNVFADALKVVDGWGLFKARLIKRIKNASGFKLIHNDAELRAIVQKGRQLNLSNGEIDDLLFISCREEKFIYAKNLMKQMDNWIKVRTRKFPFKFSSLKSYNKFKDEIRTLMKKAGVPTDDIRVQGSSLRTPNAKDVDLAVFVSQKEFNELVKSIRKRLQDTVKKYPNSSKARKNLKDFEKQVSSGRINSFQLDKVDGQTINKSLFNLSSKFKIGGIDLSVMKKGAGFDLQPNLKF